MAKQPTMQQLTITQTRSVIGANERQKRTMQALGLTKINRTVAHPDNPAIRGMVRKVAHLVTLVTPQPS